MFAEINVVQQSIDKANTASLLDILYAYKLKIDNLNHKICCPFPFHKNGQERSASFWYYPDTNSFFCYGCKSGGTSVDFVAVYEDITRYQASLLINNEYVTDDSIISEKSINYSKIYLGFSHSIREFIISHVGSTKALAHAEQMCIAFDTLRHKYILDPDGLEMLVAKLQDKLQLFQE